VQTKSGFFYAQSRTVVLNCSEPRPIVTSDKSIWQVKATLIELETQTENSWDNCSTLVAPSWVRLYFATRFDFSINLFLHFVDGSDTMEVPLLHSDRP